MVFKLIQDTYCQLLFMKELEVLTQVVLISQLMDKMELKKIMQKI